METRKIIDFSSPSLDEFRKHLRITSHDLDGELKAKLRSAIVSAEHEISTVIVPSSFTKRVRFCTSIELRWPVRTVTSVKVDGVAIPSENYEVDEASVTFTDSVQGKQVEIEYEAGLEQVPPDVQSAILLLAGSLFNNPTDRPEERDRTTARNLLRPYRTWGEH